MTAARASPEPHQKRPASGGSSATRREGAMQAGRGRACLAMPNPRQWERRGHPGKDLVRMAGPGLRWLSQELSGGERSCTADAREADEEPARRQHAKRLQPGRGLAECSRTLSSSPAIGDPGGMGQPLHGQRGISPSLRAMPRRGATAWEKLGLSWNSGRHSGLWE